MSNGVATIADLEREEITYSTYLAEAETLLASAQRLQKNAITNWSFLHAEAIKVSALALKAETDLMLAGGRKRLTRPQAIRSLTRGHSGQQLADVQILASMDERGKVINVAFCVSAAWVFADHLAFVAASYPDMILAVIVGKLVGGISAVMLAVLVMRQSSKAS